MAQVHVMHDGRSHDLEQEDLDVGLLSSDTDIRARVAEALSVPVTKLAAFSIDKNEATGDITLRPQATFG